MKNLFNKIYGLMSPANWALFWGLICVIVGTVAFKKGAELVGGAFAGLGFGFLYILVKIDSIEFDEIASGKIEQDEDLDH